MTPSTQRSLGLPLGGLVLLVLAGACGKDSRRDLVGPDPIPGPPRPVFEYVRQMTQDPWFAESLPGRLANREGAIPIDALLGVDLPTAATARDVEKLNTALTALESVIDSYRDRSGFDLVEEPVLSSFELFVQQARAIRDDRVPWAPRPLLRRPEG